MKKLYIWGVLAVFALIVGGFFYQTVLFRKLPVPSDALVGLYHPYRDYFSADYPRGVPFKNFLITDPVRQQIPWKKTVIDEWKSGKLPKNNPYSFLGAPLDANIQAAPFYPMNILFFLFDFPVAWTLLIILQPMLAMIFFFLYVRRLRVSLWPSLLGAVSWGFGGFAVSWLTWGTILHTALWLPLILLSIDTLLTGIRSRKDLFRGSATLGIALTMTILGGHIQMALYTIFISGAYLLWRMKIEKLFVRPMHAGVRALLIAGFCALAVTAVQWVPFMQFMSQSARAGALDSWKTPGWFLPWAHLIQFVVPDFFGNPATLNYWGEWNYGELVGYIGILPLIFAVSAVALSGVPRFFVFAMAVALTGMLPEPVSKLPYILHIPVVSVLQPTRLMMLVDFSLSVLFAFGLDRFLKGTRKEVWRGVMGVGIALFVAWCVVLGGTIIIRDPALLTNLGVAKRNLMLPTMLFGLGVLWVSGMRLLSRGFWKHISIAVLFTVVIFDLFRFGWKFTPFTPLAYFFPETDVIRFLETQPKPYRIMALDDRILPPNVSGYYGIETIEGYDPIASKEYQNFLASSETGKPEINGKTGFNRIYTAHNVDSRLLPYMNVRYVLSLADVKRPFLKKVMQEGETRVYEYTRTLPRVYIAEEVAVVKNEKERLQKLFEEPFSHLGIWGGYADILNVPVAADETVGISSYSTGQMRMKATLRNRRLVVILNRYDRRWKATVDGKVSTLFPVNYLFMGLVIPEGTHDIILTYR